MSGSYSVEHIYSLRTDADKPEKNSSRASIKIHYSCNSTQLICDSNLKCTKDTPSKIKMMED